MPPTATKAIIALVLYCKVCTARSAGNSNHVSRYKADAMFSPNMNHRAVKAERPNVGHPNPSRPNLCKQRPRVPNHKSSAFEVGENAFTAKLLLCAFLHGVRTSPHYLWACAHAQTTLNRFQMVPFPVNRVYSTSS